MIMKECNKICMEIEQDPLKMFDLQKWFSDNLTHTQMIELLANLYYNDFKNKKEIEPIPISKDDFQKLRSLFKIKGYRILSDGTVVEENRGGSRYRNISPFDKTE